MDKAKIELGFARAVNSSPGWEQYYQWILGEEQSTLFLPGKAKTAWLLDGYPEKSERNQETKQEKVNLRLLWSPSFVQPWKEQEGGRVALWKDCPAVSLSRKGDVSWLSWHEYKTGWFEIRLRVTCEDLLIVVFCTGKRVKNREEWPSISRGEVPGYVAAKVLEKIQGAAAVLVLSMRPCQPAVLLIGPPQKRELDDFVFQRFLKTDGVHIICGGTTATLVSDYLNQPLEPVLESGTDEIPAMGYLNGVDFVTEGVITLQKLAELTDRYLEDSRIIDTVTGRTDAVALLADQLINRSNLITIYFGCAVNPAHESLNISFTVKQKAVFTLVKNLKSMGKEVILQIN